MPPLFTALKILLQDLCKSKTDWDERLRGELNFKYTKWLSDLMKVHSISIDRCYFNQSINQSKTLVNIEFVDSKIANISEENRSIK